jgi:tRNA(fMet)-specific endonuclease VapC
MVLCDTNIFIEVYKDNPSIITALKSIGQVNIAISDVTCAELLYGARNKLELKIIKQDLEKLFILPISSAISAYAVNLIEQYTLSHNLNLPDALIAATAIIHNIELYTINLKDFRFLTDISLFNA